MHKICLIYPVISCPNDASCMFYISPWKLTGHCKRTRTQCIVKLFYRTLCIDEQTQILYVFYKDKIICGGKIEVTLGQVKYGGNLRTNFLLQPVYMVILTGIRKYPVKEFKFLHKLNQIYSSLCKFEKLFLRLSN